MQLDLIERHTLSQTLPERGDFVTIKILRELRENLAATEEEALEFNLRASNAILQAGQGQKNIKITEMQRQIIVEALKDADKNKRLTMQHISLWEKFVESK